jgi:PAS domain S-box-containing protein
LVCIVLDSRSSDFVSDSMNSTIGNMHALGQPGASAKADASRRNVWAWVAVVCAVVTVIWIFKLLATHSELKSAQAAGGLVMIGSATNGAAGTSWWPWLFGIGVLASVSVIAMLLQLQDRWKNSYARVCGQLEAAATEIQLLRSRSRSEVSEARESRRELDQVRNELEERISTLMRRNAILKEDLDQRRRAELSLSIQREELVRSKDVLELHVQARTIEVRKLQRRNELILNAAGEGICGMAPDGTIAFANPAAAEITGWQIEELIGNSAEKIFGNTLRRDGNGSPSRESAETFYRKDGSLFLSECMLNPIEESGKRVGDVLIFRDVTSKRHAERELAEKAEELARSNAELEQFAFVASHDLQEPLRKILAFGDRLKAKCDAAQLTDGRDFLERMQNAAARMQTLINDLLTFSRVISRAQPFTPVDLNVVTREVLNDLEVRIEKSKARVEVSELPIIDGDPTQLRQLIQNLVGNALKFHAAGASPVVRVQAKQVPDAENPARPGAGTKKGDATEASERWEITVEDNGIGFEEKYLEKMFAVFQRLHGRQEYEGTGIGLAVCRRIVERHDGTITARGKPGEGACFIVRLPARQPKSQEAKS